MNILAALGLGQLRRIDQFLEKKRFNHHTYKGFFDCCDEITLFSPPDQVETNHWLNMVTFHEDVISRLGLSEMIKLLRKDGIQTRPMWTLLHELPMFRDKSFVSTENSQYVHSRSLTIPSDISLTREDIDFVSSRIIDLCQKASPY